ncbi:hypothetical protein D3C78_960450 [compost metagenome]
MLAMKRVMQPLGDLAFIAVPSIHLYKLSETSWLSAASRLWMSSNTITSGRSFLRLSPRTEPPATIILRPRKPNFLIAFVSFSTPSLQSPNTILMFGSSSISKTSEIMFSAIVAVAAITSTNLRSVKRITYRMNSLTMVDLPKPRGSPRASLSKFRSL